MDYLTLLWLSLLAGIFAPLGSPCVLVLYPGYLAYLAGESGKEAGRALSTARAGLVVAAGILMAMLAGGVVYLALVQSLGVAARNAITIIIFSLLLVFSLILVLDLDLGRLGTFRVPRPENPVPAAFLYGLSFGIVILPCNAAAITVMLALAATTSGLVEGLGAFLCFGLGITLPLLVLAIISRAQSRRILQFIHNHQRPIRAGAGLFMLAIAVWYLALLLVPGLIP
jgi:cytochrome c-type biogenesis protein